MNSVREETYELKLGQYCRVYNEWDRPCLNRRRIFTWIHKTNLYLQRILRIPENGVVNTAARNADHVDEETKHIK